jgi:hypothetical protein
MTVTTFPVHARRDPEPYTALVRRLSTQSVKKHFDAYEDVDWNAPDNRLDVTDPRFELPGDDPLGATEWYRGLPQGGRAELGLEVIASQMKTGLEFESILSRGLLEFTSELDNGAPEFRYAYHEIIEEGQHTLMFQEFINRTGLAVRGLAPLDKAGSRFVPRLGRAFPELFFFFVLGGEVPIDRVQRDALGRREDLHPLLRRIIQIHVTEEARHICFAKRFLEERVPKLGVWRRFQLMVRLPLIFSVMARQMLAPPAHLVRRWQIPSAVVRQAYLDNPIQRARLLESLEPIRQLCHRLGLITRPLLRVWQWLGIAPRDHAQLPPASGPRLPPPSERVETRSTTPRAVPGVVRACPREWLFSQAC